MNSCETRQVEFHLALRKKVLKKGEKKLTDMILAAEKVTEFVICTLVTGKTTMQILRTEKSSDTVLQEIRGIIGGPTVENCQRKGTMFLLSLEGPSRLGKMSW